MWVRLGNMFFRYRNIAGPLLFFAALTLSRPEYPFGSADANLALDIAGVLLASLGQALRVLTVGYQYIVRGGRNRRVYADSLVQRGAFAHCRNPLYLGNILIAAGIALIIHAEAFYAIVLPAIVLVYGAIVAAEEAYLRSRFGAEYDAYCQRVGRWLPRLRGFEQSIAGMRFHWQRVIVKEYNTMFLLVATLFGVRLWSEYCISGEGSIPGGSTLLACFVAWLVLYLLVRELKIRRVIGEQSSGPMPPT